MKIHILSVGRTVIDVAGDQEEELKKCLEGDNAQLQVGVFTQVLRSEAQAEGECIVSVFGDDGTFLKGFEY